MPDRSPNCLLRPQHRAKLAPGRGNDRVRTERVIEQALDAVYPRFLPIPSRNSEKHHIAASREKAETGILHIFRANRPLLALLRSHLLHIPPFSLRYADIRLNKVSASSNSLGFPTAP